MDQDIYPHFDLSGVVDALAINLSTKIVRASPLFPSHFLARLAGLGRIRPKHSAETPKFDHVPVGDPHPVLPRAHLRATEWIVLKLVATPPGIATGTAHSLLTSVTFFIFPIPKAQSWRRSYVSAVARLCWPRTIIAVASSICRSLSCLGAASLEINVTLR